MTDSHTTRAIQAAEIDRTRDAMMRQMRRPLSGSRGDLLDSWPAMLVEAEYLSGMADVLRRYVPATRRRIRHFFGSRVTPIATDAPWIIIGSSPNAVAGLRAAREQVGFMPVEAAANAGVRVAMEASHRSGLGDEVDLIWCSDPIAFVGLTETFLSRGRDVPLIANTHGAAQSVSLAASAEVILHYPTATAFSEFDPLAMRNAALAGVQLAQLAALMSATSIHLVGMEGYAARESDAADYFDGTRARSGRARENVQRYGGPMVDSIAASGVPVFVYGEPEYDYRHAEIRRV